jgi:SAM-dependent methyltransferase
MTFLRKIVPIIAVLWLAQAHAADLGRSAVEAELLKQDSIYQGQGQDRDKGYTVDRPLASYADGFPSEFARVFGKLTPQDRWLDIGAGEGQAILDYYTGGYNNAQLKTGSLGDKRAQAVAMSIEDRRSALWQRTTSTLPFNQIQYFAGKRLREYSSAELGHFQLITDMLGGFSYTNDLALYMEKVLDLLAVNGSFFTVLQDVHREDGSNAPYYAGSPFLTEIADADGAELKVCSWLKRIACVEVVCEPRAHWKPPLESYRVRKICNDVKVPPLTPLHYQAGTPPERRYQVPAVEAESSQPTNVH